MTSESLLRFIVLAQAAVLVGVGLAYFGHGILVDRRRTRDARAVGRARPPLMRAIEDGTGAHDAAAVAALRAVPRRVQVDVLDDLMARLSGDDFEHLASLAARLGILERAVRSSRSRLWWNRRRAARLLAQLGDEPDVLRRLLADPVPVVRAEAAEWAGRAGPELVTAAVALLDDPNGWCRFAAQEALVRSGAAAVAPLVAYLGAHRGVELLPALEVAAAVPDLRFGAAVAGACHDPDPVVRARGAEVLGSIGGETSTAVLILMLDDESAAARAAAASGLGRLRHWPAASSLVGSLRDPVFEVRRQAGLALLEMGPPGVLLLRRMRSDDDRYAAEMARQVLEVRAVLAGREPREEPASGRVPESLSTTPEAERCPR